MRVCNLNKSYTPHYICISAVSALCESPRVFLVIFQKFNFNCLHPTHKQVRRQNKGIDMKRNTTVIVTSSCAFLLGTVISSLTGGSSSDQIACVSAATIVRRRDNTFTKKQMNFTFKIHYRHTDWGIMQARLKIRNKNNNNSFNSN
jgi:hypothetical protein